MGIEDESWEYALDRYVEAQDYVVGANGTTQYDRALDELVAGRKESHWMWFIFPQIMGLGSSMWDATYSIKNIEEAKDYLVHPILGERIRTCVEVVLGNASDNPTDIFDYPDDLKLKSSMTLFEIAAGGHDTVFGEVIDKYYSGERDALTVQILGSMQPIEYRKQPDKG